MRRDLKKAIRLLREANDNLAKARVLLKDYAVFISPSEVVVPFDIVELANEVGADLVTKGSPFGGMDTTFTVEGIRFIQYGIAKGENNETL